VRTLSGELPPITIGANATWAELKRAIIAQYPEISPDRLQLFLNNEPIEGYARSSIAKMGITNGTELGMVILPPKPGKNDKLFNIIFTNPADGSIMEDTVIVSNNATYKELRSAILEKFISYAPDNINPAQYDEALVVKSNGKYIYGTFDRDTIKFLKNNTPLHVTFDTPIYGADINLFALETGRKWGNIMLTQYALFKQGSIHMVYDAISGELGLKRLDTFTPVDYNEMKSNEINRTIANAFTYSHHSIYADTPESHQVQTMEELFHSNSTQMYKDQLTDMPLLSVILRFYKSKQGGSRGRTRKNKKSKNRATRARK
jgi:hypothetical protein